MSCWLTYLLQKVGGLFFFGSCVADSMAGAPLANNNMLAAESTSVVVFISGGLARPDWRYMLFANLTDIIESMFMSPPDGSPCQLALGFQVLFHSHLP